MAVSKERMSCHGNNGHSSYDNNDKDAVTTVTLTWQQQKQLLKALGVCAAEEPLGRGLTLLHHCFCF